MGGLFSGLFSHPPPPEKKKKGPDMNPLEKAKWDLKVQKEVVEKKIKLLEKAMSVRVVPTAPERQRLSLPSPHSHTPLCLLPLEL